MDEVNGFGKNGFMPMARHAEASAGIQPSGVVESCGKLAWVGQQDVIVRARNRQIIMAKPNAPVVHARGDAGSAQGGRQSLQSLFGMDGALHPRQQARKARPKARLFAGLRTAGIDGFESSGLQGRPQPSMVKVQTMRRPERFPPCGPIGSYKSSSFAAQSPKRLGSNQVGELVAKFIQRGVGGVNVSHGALIWAFGCGLYHACRFGWQALARSLDRCKINIMENEKTVQAQGASGWRMGKIGLDSAEALRKALAREIDFPLPMISWQGVALVESEELESWMNERGFVGVSMRDAGWFWMIQKKDAAGKPDGARLIEVSDVDRLWAELGKWSTQLEAGLIELASWGQGKREPLAKSRKSI